MDFHRSFSQAQFSTDALVWQTQHHEAKHTALAFTQSQMSPVSVFAVWLCRSRMAGWICRRLDAQSLGHIHFLGTQMVLEPRAHHCGM